MHRVLLLPLSHAIEPSSEEPIPFRDKTFLRSPRSHLRSAATLATLPASSAYVDAESAFCQIDPMQSAQYLSGRRNTSPMEISPAFPSLPSISRHRAPLHALREAPVRTLDGTWI